MPWGLEIGPLASVGALMVSLLALWISWRVYRRQASADLPVVSADLIRHAEGWWRVKISVLNRSPVEWSAAAVTVRKPRGARILREQSLSRSQADKPWVIEQDPLPDPATLSNRAKTFLAVLPAGQGGSHRSDSMLVWVPPSRRSAILSIRVSLSSKDAARRQITTDIVRALSEAARTAKA